jgi:hypothetical protein
MRRYYITGGKWREIELHSNYLLGNDTENRVSNIGYSR